MGETLRQITKKHEDLERRPGSIEDILKDIKLSLGNKI